jgi:uncharacterized membrane protein YfcA
MELPLDLPAVLYLAVVVLVAAYVRGFAGFGFALISVPSLALLLPPSEVVPALFLTSLGSAAHLVPRVWSNVHWRSVSWMLLGAVAATPVGVALLSAIPAAEMRIAIALVVLVTAVLLWQGFALQVVPGRAPAFATGIASGFLNGSAGIGGPPVVLFYFSSPTAGAVGRASLIVYFFVLDLVGIGATAAAGLITAKTFLLALLILPPLMLGIWAGHRKFVATDPALFRRLVLLLLIALAVATAGKALYELRGAA